MNEIIEAVGVIVCTTALFAAIMFCLTVPPKVIKKLLSTIACITAIGALLFYGYGYACNDEPFWVSVIRATFAVCKIFVGGNAWGDVKNAFVSPVMQVLFWLLHLMGLFTSASAAIASLGSGLLRKLRLWAFRKRDITIIFGLSENTLDFGKELIRQGMQSILYVDKTPTNALSSAVDQMGAILRSDADALNTSERFLKSIGLQPGSRKVWVYALSPDFVSNQQFAKRMLASMKAADISAEQTSLTIMGPGDETDNQFQSGKEQYGYGSVISINEPEMVARMLVRTYPPCDVIEFDQTGKAQNDFHGLIIGFGQVGQAVLQQLTMNGQFHGNHFRLAVFAPNYEQMMGRLAHECSSMLEHYDISFHAFDGRSCQMYDYIAEHAETLNYITICAGSNAINMEIAEQLQSFLRRRNCHAPIYMCSHWGICQQVSSDQLVAHKTYTPEVLCTDQIDRMAMVLNHSYTGSGDMRQNWRECGYFNRMSSRAAADFYYALLRAAGVTAEEAIKHWQPEGELLENLSITEHLRWNAFHYCMGFRPMTEQEFAYRVREYKKEKEKDPNTRYRITRDMDRRIHACLISWEELNAYSAKENAITGGCRDYQENDRINIRAVADVLRAMEE